jgi:hypothetical protein
LETIVEMVTSPAGTVEMSSGAITRMIGVPPMGVDGPIEDRTGIEDIVDDCSAPGDDVGVVISGGVVAAGDEGVGVDVAA